MRHLEELRRLSRVISDTALCGLGQTAPNPVLSTLNSFWDEYVAHVKEHRCPAGRCQKLIRYFININCIGCTACARKCPVGCISGERKQRHVIDFETCIKCGACYAACKFHAIDKK